MSLYPSHISRENMLSIYDAFSLHGWASLAPVGLTAVVLSCGPGSFVRGLFRLLQSYCSLFAERWIVELFLYCTILEYCCLTAVLIETIGNAVCQYHAFACSLSVDTKPILHCCCSHTFCTMEAAWYYSKYLK